MFTHVLPPLYCFKIHFRISHLQDCVSFELVIAGEKIIEGNDFLWFGGKDVLYQFFIYCIYGDDEFVVVDAVIAGAFRSFGPVQADMLNRAGESVACFEH